MCKCITCCFTTTLQGSVGEKGSEGTPGNDGARVRLTRLFLYLYLSNYSVIILQVIEEFTVTYIAK